MPKHMQPIIAKLAKDYEISQHIIEKSVNFQIQRGKPINRAIGIVRNHIVAELQSKGINAK